LISDISSVISDFLASEKPYAVFNHTSMTAADFVRDYRSTSAATIVGRDGSGIAEFIAVVTRTAPDTMAATRSRLATYLLGSPEQRTLAAFQESVTGFIARSDVERADYRTRPDKLVE
jgi:CDP-glycerol glycerophosphotransferase (TagB/SpsB family)